MTSSAPPPSVKPIAALLYRDMAAREQALAALSVRWGAIAHCGAAHPFDRTAYYAAEMGTDLVRCVVAFAGLWEPPRLVEAKHEASAVEDALRTGGKRSVNVDPGYLDLFKVVLASWKGRGNKLYLERGVWADLQLTFGKGRFQPLPWTFPDFAEGRYDADLLAIRAAYRAERATVHGQQGG